MVDTARQLLDELMGRNRNLDPTHQSRKVNWDDPEFCLFYLVKFCPHDLFVNTRADLGQCPKLHDDEAKRMYEEARPSIRKRNYEDEFLRFSNHMINEVERKIEKGKERLQLMNKGDKGTPVVYVSKFQEQINNINARIKKLIGEAEEAGNRGDVDQAQGLMTLCDQLKDEKEQLVQQHENGGPEGTPGAPPPPNPHKSQWTDFTTTEKQMEVCEVCGAFLIVGDAQQRIEDHLTGKQHLGYSKLRKAVEEMYEKRKLEREEEDKNREEERRNRSDNGYNSNRRDDRRDDRRKRDDFDNRRRRDERSSSSSSYRRDRPAERFRFNDRNERSDRNDRHTDRYRTNRRDDRRDHRDKHRSRSGSRSRSRSRTSRSHSKH